MARTQDAEITGLLREWSAGDDAAFERLVSVIYGDLRSLAARCLTRERPDHTLQPTELVHETFLRLVNQREVDWHDRRHFFSIAAKLMRRILVDHARRRGFAKRRPASSALRVENLDGLAGPPRPDLVALDASLDALADVDPLKVTIVELRFFAGFSLEETASILDCSRATVARHWQMAKAWLLANLTETRPQ